MSNKSQRELLEMQNVFSDPKFSRQAWKAIGQAILRNPAVRPVQFCDKEGNETLGSMIESYSYSALKRDLATLGEQNREPTELEMILQCQIVKARYDTAAATFVRDTLGAKPVDETKLDASVNNPYEQLSDEELELIAKVREEKLKAAQEVSVLTSAKEADYDLVRADNDVRRGDDGSVHIRPDVTD